MESPASRCARAAGRRRRSGLVRSWFAALLTIASSAHAGSVPISELSLEEILEVRVRDRFRVQLVEVDGDGRLFTF